jgi:2-methylisocitrate lyase-like PEP mutase family enzyme
MTSTDTVATFRALHAQDHVLVIPNVWDAASAAVFKAAGAQAIATTSCGLAWSCGYPDGDVLPQDDLLFTVRAICRVTRGTPVSVDFESGYSSDPHAVAEAVVKLREIGAVGINLEDGADLPQLTAEKIAAIKRAVANHGDIFINARTDVYLRELATGEDAIRETIERGKRFKDAGADGFFVPALTENGAIKRISSSIPLPLNVLVWPGLAPLDTLYGLGVRRLSAGGRLAEVALSAARTAARAFMRDESRDEAVAHPGGVTYDEMNALFQ